MTTPRPDTGTTEQPSTDQQKAAETAVAGTEQPDGTPGTPENAETFPRAVVEELRRENAEHRVKAKAADDLAHRLHLALVTATGRLADPTDLPFDPAHLDDPDALSAALDDLVARKPHLADRRPRGHVGQGATAETASIDLAGMLRSRAG